MNKTTRIQLVNTDLFTFIDSEDWQRVRRISERWYYHKKSEYVLATPHGKTVLLHRLIMRAQQGTEIDHLDGDRLDNRKSNLRFCTRAENLRNCHTKEEIANARHRKNHALFIIQTIYANLTSPASKRARKMALKRAMQEIFRAEELKRLERIEQFKRDEL